MARFGFFPASTADYSRGEEPEIARRLGRLARALHLHLIGISGYRSPAHSVAVGGFPNDPHTRGQASDTPGIEGVPESTLRRYGLTRPFPGAREADHIQLLGGGRGNRSPAPNRGRRVGPADWLKQAGWPENLIPIMVAIGGAESGWNVHAQSPTNSDGSVDYGWLQINSVHGYDPVRLKSDPVYTARAGLRIYRGQGLKAWTTYTSGAYKQYMGQRPPDSAFGRTRPGGEAPGGPDPNTELAAFWDHGPTAGLGLLPNPLDLFKSAGKSITATADFFKWIAWIFHPLNILRAVELLFGFPTMGMGIWIMVQVWKGGDAQAPMRLIGDVASMTPVGRGVRVAKGARLGKSQARSQVRKKQTQKAMDRGRKKETQRQGNKQLSRDARRDKRRGEEIPF